MEKTFLFLGLSFTDPNLYYVLGRLRTQSPNPREHFAFMRREQKDDPEFENQGDFEQSSVLQQLFIADLKRYGIEVLLVDDYGEITGALEALEQAYRSSSVLISGSADDTSPWGSAQVEGFLTRFSKALVHEDFRIVTGFGKGIGNHVVAGALEEVLAQKKRLEEHLVMRPFPVGNPELYSSYRREMLAHAGIAVFLFGQKDGQPAPGVLEEFEMAKELGVVPVPVGGTGGAAKIIYDRVAADFGSFFPGADPKFTEHFRTLGVEQPTPEAYLEPLLRMMHEIRGEF